LKIPKNEHFVLKKILASRVMKILFIPVILKNDLGMFSG
jgi:hypothetical protein